MEKHQGGRIQQSIISARYYGNLPLYGAAGVSVQKLLSQRSKMQVNISFNAIQSVIDTITARIGETKPKPYFLTSGGDYKAQRKAKRLNWFIEGTFYETRQYDLGLQCFRDGGIWGDGFEHVYPDWQTKRVCHERVMESEIWVDEEEAKYGSPRTLFRVKTVDRDELAAIFPERRDFIMNAGRQTDKNGRDILNVSDMLKVRMAWHLPSGSDEKDGRYCVAIDEGLLTEPDEETWEWPCFPFAKQSYCPRPIGYWSQGIAERQQGAQSELNKELWLIQRSMHLAGSVKVFLRNGSKIVKEHVNNEIGAIISHTGEPPTFFCPEPIHQTYFDNVNRIIARIYQQEGVSELSAQSKKPEGLDSGKAIREYEDIESDRFRTVSRQNDNFYLDVAKLDILCARDIAKASGGKYRVRVPGKSSAYRELELTPADFEPEAFMMQCFPVSRLPNDPSGRLQTIQEYIQAGFITPRHGKRLLDFPDIDAYEALSNAQEDLLTFELDNIVDEGKYAGPEPTDDLDLAKELAIEYIQRFRMLELEPERLEMLRFFNSQTDFYKQQAQQALMAQQTPNGMGQPQAAAMPPPVSQLVPNVPSGNAGPAAAA